MSKTIPTRLAASSAWVMTRTDLTYYSGDDGLNLAHLVNGDQVLSFQGRVAWRQGNRTGLAFVGRAPGHDLLVQGALRQLLRAPQPTHRLALESDEARIGSGRA